MAFVHGKTTYFMVNATDLSAFTNNVAPKRSADSHDTTTFGKNSKTYAGGLKDGAITATGIYDDGATGPAATLEPLLGATVTYAYRPEGTGAGKPEKTGSAVLTAYEETAPVADMITWSCTLQLSGDVAIADQV